LIEQRRCDFTKPQPTQRWQYVPVELTTVGIVRFVKFFGPGVCANLGPGPR